MPLASIGLACGLYCIGLTHCTIQHQNIDVALSRTNCGGQGVPLAGIGKGWYAAADQEQEKRRPRPKSRKRIIIGHTEINNI